MAFQDSVAQALTGTDAAANAPTQPPTPQPAPDISAPSPASTAPATAPTVGRPAPAQPAQPAPQQSAEPAQPEAPGEHFRNLSHALKGALLGVVAAGPRHVVDHYQVDDSGKMTPVMRPTGATDRLRLLAQAALQGLAAGSRVPSGPNRGAQFARGIGAGFEAQQSQAMQADLLKRQQATEDFDAQEKRKTDNAVRAMHLATTYSLWQKAMDEQNDHDPERAKNMDVVNAAKDYISRNPTTEMSVQIVSPEQAKAIHEQEIAALQSDPTHKTKLSVMLPLGMTGAKDQDGNPLFEQDGATPKQVGQIAVIKGGDKIPLPQSFVDDAKEYGTLAGIVGGDRLTAGQEVPVASFLTMDAKLNQAKNQEIEGWKNAKDVILADGTHGQLNTITNKTRPFPEGAQPNVENKVQAQKTEEKLKTAQTAEAWAKAREADAKRLNDQGQHFDAFGNVSPLNEKEFNKRYDAFNKSKAYTNLQTLQGSYQQFQSAVSDLNAGKDLTGAASVVGLFNAIGISATPLAGKGFRINENTIREHVDARGLDQAAYQKLLALQNGDVITPQQLRDYASIAANVYRDSYINTANEEFRQLGVVDVLPRGNNTMIDPMTARLYLTIAGNNPDLATEAAAKNGWIVPSSKGQK